jgi:peptide/nickel transport system substrate-binding protein
LTDALDEAIATTFIPYVEVLENYTTAQEALAKYNALKDWYDEKGHFWIGNGPFYLESVYPTEQQVVINAFREHPDTADRWAIFTEPKLPELSVSGPDTVTQSLPAEFVLSVTFKGEPYPTDELDFVKYLVIGPTGEVLSVGEAIPGEEGIWKIKLSAADTSLIPTGTSTIEFVASSKLVSIPASDDMSFITISFGDFLSVELGKLRAELNATISGLQDTATQLESKFGSLESTVSNLNTIATVSVIIAAIAIVISLAITVLFRKK